MAFKPVSSQVNLPEVEQKISDFWRENEIFKQSLDKNAENEKYVFVDGPPFVSGLPHYGSLLPSIAKDVFPRYQTMNGKRVRRVWGWDCHGLPIEEKVNALFGIKTRAQVEEKMGIEKYVGECRTYVENVTSDWRWYIEKIGRWVDMDNAYMTMKVDYMESVIWAFKQIYEKGLVYKGKRVSMYSTDTSTPVSQFEVAMDNDNYQEVEDLSVFVKFEVKDVPGFLKKDDKKAYFIAWTTTPWTIPVNFALAVNPNYKYVLVEYENQLFMLLKERVEFAFGVKRDEVGTENDKLVKIITEFSANKLEGLTYIPVYEYFTSQKKEKDFSVILSEEVTNEEGTGVLHIAPAYGEVDFQLGKKNNLSDLSDIDAEGKMTVDPWMGIYLREASPLIAEDMEKKGSLLRSLPYTHRLPFYRGKNPLIYMAQEAYFIDIQKIKQRMIELNEKINWIPKHLKHGRFLQTLETSPDWCVSRNRYWATIMPIWRSDDGEEIVVGSLKEIAQFSDQIEEREGKYFFEDKPMDLHRDVCDRIILKKDGKEFRRISEVLDVWMDSGSVPFAEYHYPFENRDDYEQSRPADLIIEYVGQVRAWFNILLRVSTILFDDIPFKTALTTGVLAGTDGRKMSKSYGNYPDPKMVLEKYGGDALRLYLMGSPVMKGEDLNIMEEGIAENYKFLLVLWNSYKYFVDYGNIYNWSCELPGGNGDRKNLTVLDKWILARLTQLVLDMRKSLDNYDVVTATKLIKEFLVNDFSTWYIRRSRDRVSNNDNEIDRNACLSVLYGVLVGYSKLAAPIMPFITEEIYLNLGFDSSVHLSDYPKGDKSFLDERLVEDMKVVRAVVEKGHALRKDAQLKLRQPLSKITYFFKERLSEELEQIIADELNVKSVAFKQTKNEEISVELDTKITPELKSEGEARDIIRQIQSLRKENNLTLKDKIEIFLPAWPKEFEEMILKSTAAVKINQSEQVTIEKV
jgi:isoleucyl-tRNA synthetase